jgi:hypothetical protein
MADKYTIQRLPVGLLDLLGMQSTGDTPHSIAESVIPSIELTDLYLTDRLASIFGSSGALNATTSGNVANQGPPDGYQWLLYGCSYTSGAVAAAASISWVPAIYRASLGAYQAFGEKQLLAATQIAAKGIWFERPLVMRPGDRCGYIVADVTGVPALTLNLNSFYVPIRI